MLFIMGAVILWKLREARIVGGSSLSRGANRDWSIGAGDGEGLVGRSESIEDWSRLRFLVAAAFIATVLRPPRPRPRPLPCPDAARVGVSEISLVSSILKAGVAGSFSSLPADTMLTKEGSS